MNDFEFLSMLLNRGFVKLAYCFASYHSLANNPSVEYFAPPENGK